jgi:hypothetical protein
MKRFTRWLILPCAVMLASSCTPILTKHEAFPRMYDERPMSILVLPPINESTAAEATEYYSTTIAEPLSLKGYYVLPLEVVFELLRQEGLFDAEMLLRVQPSKFREYFGADAILYVRILKWDKAYYVVGGHVTVSADFQLISTHTGEKLWQYNGTIKLDTSGDSGGNNGLAGLAVALIVTAVKTATADYQPLAKEANVKALTSIPYGKYHSMTGQDQEEDVVKEDVMQESDIKGNE